MSYVVSKYKLPKRIEDNIMLCFFKLSTYAGLAIYNLIDGLMDEFEDETGVDVAGSTNESYDSVNDLYSPALTGYGFDFLTGGTASASSELGVGNEASKANDDNEGTQWASANTTAVHWWKYDLGAGVTKTARKLRFRVFAAGQVKNFTLQGSNNDADWTNLHTDVYPNGTTAFQEYTFANSTAYRYYRLYITDNWIGGYDSLVEIELMELSIPGNMTLISNAVAAEAVPVKSRIVLFEEDVDAVTVNTDIKSYVSRDGGTTWTQHTLVSEGNYETGKRILSSEATAISAQPSGQSMKWKVETLNNKNLKLHAVGVSWD